MGKPHTLSLRVKWASLRVKWAAVSKRASVLALVFLAALVDTALPAHAQPPQQDDAAPVPVAAEAPATWSSIRRARFAEKIAEINASHTVPNDRLRPADLAVILRQPHCPLDATWIPFHGEALTIAHRNAIVPAGTHVFRGIKMVNDHVIDSIRRNGLDSPIMFRYEQTPALVDDEFVTSDPSLHVGVGSRRSALVSTSYDRDRARAFAGIAGGIVVEIVLEANQGIDINALLGHHAYEHEHEVDVAFRVKPTQIVSIIR